MKGRFCPELCGFRNKDYCPSNLCQLIPQPDLRIINGRYPVEETPAIEVGEDYFEKMRKQLHSILDENGTAVYDYAVGDMVYFFQQIYNSGLDTAIAAVETFLKERERIEKEYPRGCGTCLLSKAITLISALKKGG